MIHDPRVAVYTAAAIQGILASEPTEVEYLSSWVASRAVEIAAETIAAEDRVDEEPLPEEETDPPVKGIWPGTSEVSSEQPADDSQFENTGPAELAAAMGLNTVPAGLEYTSTIHVGIIHEVSKSN